jgi:hypothetical protein
VSEVELPNPGGNSKQRKAYRKLSAKDNTAIVVAVQAAPLVLQKSAEEWREPLNRADSFGLLALVMGILFVIIVPTIWVKAPAFLLVCFGTGYLIWLSHWTYHIRRAVRFIAIVVIVSILCAGVIPQLVAQWHLEHLRSQLKFEGSAPGVSYPDGDHYGISWSKTYAEVRLTIKSGSPTPIQNLNISMAVMDKGFGIAGMVQSEPELGGCAVRRPRENLIAQMLIKGADGSRADIAPFMNDEMNKMPMPRDHYDLLCERVLANDSIPLVIATTAQKLEEDTFLPPPRFHITGDYETPATEGSKRVMVDEIVNISRPQPWK